MSPATGGGERRSPPNGVRVSVVRGTIGPHVLLGLTLVLIAIQPLGTEAGGLYTRIVLALVIVSSVVAVRHRRRLFVLGIVLGAPAVILTVLDPGGEPTRVGLALGLSTLSFVCVALLVGIFEGRTVTAGSISSSLSVYLLLGIVWSLAYLLVELGSPGSFYGLGEGSAAETQRDLLYYSFMTLVTVGYGDIGPVSPGARALAISEAVVGQLYLVVLVASLVGMFLSMQSRRGDRG